jgi:hypothetical protein
MGAKGNTAFCGRPLSARAWLEARSIPSCFPPAGAAASLWRRTCGKSGPRKLRTALCLEARLHLLVSVLRRPASTACPHRAACCRLRPAPCCVGGSQVARATRAMPRARDTKSVFARDESQTGTSNLSRLRTKFPPLGIVASMAPAPDGHLTAKRRTTLGDKTNWETGNRNKVRERKSNYRALTSEKSLVKSVERQATSQTRRRLKSA